MAAAPQKLKSPDFGLWTFLLLLNLLPEARYDTPHLASPLTVPLFNINCPPSSKTISLPPSQLRLSWSTGNVFCIMPVLIRLAAAADIVIEPTPLEAEVHLFCEQRGDKKKVRIVSVIALWDCLSCDCQFGKWKKPHLCNGVDKIKCRSDWENLEHRTINFSCNPQ